MVVRWWWNSKTLNWPLTRVPMELTKWRTWRRKQARRELLGPLRGFRWVIFVSAEATVQVWLFGNFFQAKGIQFLSVNCSLPATRKAFDQHISGYRLALPLLSRLETRTYRLWSILRRRQLPLLDVFYQAPFTCPHCPQFFPQFPHLCGLVKTEKIPPENVSILFILRMKKWDFLEKFPNMVTCQVVIERMCCRIWSIWYCMIPATRKPNIPPALSNNM